MSILTVVDWLVIAAYFSIILGLCFIVIVYFIPGGLAPLIERHWQNLYRRVREKVFAP